MEIGKKTLGHSFCWNATGGGGDMTTNDKIIEKFQNEIVAVAQ
jgi:hypothetical protein